MRVGLASPARRRRREVRPDGLGARSDTYRLGIADATDMIVETSGLNRRCRGDRCFMTNEGAMIDWAPTLATNSRWERAISHGDFDTARTPHN